MEVSINKQDFTITGTQFQFVVPPTVLSINPKSGSARGGTIIASMVITSTLRRLR